MPSKRPCSRTIYSNPWNQLLDDPQLVELERELRSNLIYRRFTHFDAEATPDCTVFSRTFALLGPSVTEKIHRRVVGLAGEEGVAEGHKLRIDRTAVRNLRRARKAESR